MSTAERRPSDSYWPWDDVERDRPIVPGLLDAGWTRRAGRECGTLTSSGVCRELGQWGHPEHSRPERPLCAPHAHEREQQCQQNEQT